MNLKLSCYILWLKLRVTNTVQSNVAWRSFQGQITRKCQPVIYRDTVTYRNQPVWPLTSIISWNLRILVFFHSRKSVRPNPTVRSGSRLTWKDVMTRPRVREAPCLTLKSFLHGQKRLRLFIPIIELPLITAVINFHLDTILTSKDATWTLNDQIRICFGFYGLFRQVFEEKLGQVI